MFVPVDGHRFSRVVDVPLAHHADTERASELAERAALEVAQGEHADDVTEPPTILGVQSALTAAGVPAPTIAGHR